MPKAAWLDWYLFGYRLGTVTVRLLHECQATRATESAP